MKYTITLAAMLLATSAMARDTITTVGSSTVFPFATTVAEAFGQTTDYPTPLIESTGSGGGLKLFCAGVGVKTPDITNASRQIKPSEVQMCRENGVTPVEVKIGYDGIVLATSIQGYDFSLTLEELRSALEMNSPYMYWNEINPSLPAIRIKVYGPPPTSGTRDAFEELVNVEIREDGVFVEAGENDNLIVNKLVADSDALGIFGFSFLEENLDKIKAATLDGVEPEYELIADGSYPLARSLYFYYKKEHLEVIPGLSEYLDFFVDPAQIGSESENAYRGLIALDNDEIVEQKLQ